MRKPTRQHSSRKASFDPRSRAGTNFESIGAPIEYSAPTAMPKRNLRIASGVPAHSEGLPNANNNESNDVDEEHPAPPELIGEKAEEWGTDEDTQQARCTNNPLHSGGEPEAVIDVQNDDADYLVHQMCTRPLVLALVGE
ncbi:hypothetical protein KB1_19640 [Cutibacterium modestum]|jgi:hypothetical protein|uniref:Uncharacterized protein n=2 Tax=Cutibacterium modestum TaxID=2559073 RepID=A0AAD1NWP4_9ACTN|nr:hypothetical protein KB1_19640 [Cutibacterium modestum]